jgi:hypothetical protein
MNTAQSLAAQPCPICSTPPVFRIVPGRYWVASCQNSMCALASDVALQPTFPQAVAQWNEVALQFKGGN